LSNTLLTSACPLSDCPETEKTVIWPHHPGFFQDDPRHPGSQHHKVFLAGQFQADEKIIVDTPYIRGPPIKAN